MTIQTFAKSMLFVVGTTGIIFFLGNGFPKMQLQKQVWATEETITPTCTPSGGISVSEAVIAGQSATVVPTSQPTPTGIVLPVAPPQTGR